MKRVRNVEKGNFFLRLLGHRRGSSTLEYVIVIAAGALFATLLFMAIQSQEGVLRERITALLKGELIQVQPIGERENPETKSSGTGVPTPSMSENPGEGLSFSPFLPPDPEKGWADKAKEIPIIGNIVGKTEPLYDEYLKPFGDWSGIGPVAGEVADFFDPIPDIYELTTGKDWDTGEELGGYDRIVEPFLQYFVGKKVGKVGKLAAKADNKLLGGKITKKAGELLEPVKVKRDQFVKWACGSSPDKDCLMRQILGWSEDKYRKDKVARGGYNWRKEFRRRIENARWDPHGYKHKKAKTVEEAREISMTGKNPPAQYLPDVDNRKLEREAFRKAEYIYVDEGGAVFFIYNAGKVIGFDKGKPAKWIRAELTKDETPTLHGHPMSEKRVKEYIEGKKKKLRVLRRKRIDE